MGFANAIFQQLIFGKRAYGVDLLFRDDGSVSAAFVLMEQSKEGFSILETGWATSFDSLFEDLKKGIPAHVVVAGKGVLMHARDAKNSNESNDFLSMVSSKDVVMESLSSSDIAWEAVVKKSWLEQTLEETFKSASIELASIRLTGLFVQDYLSLFDNPPNSIGFHRYAWQSNFILKYSPVEAPEADTKRYFDLDAVYGVAWLAALRNFEWIPSELLQNDSALVLRNGARNRSLKTLALGLASLIFLTVIINLVVFMSLRTQDGQLNETLAQLEMSTQRQSQTEVLDSKRQKLVNATFFDERFSKQQILDQLGQTIHKEISITHLSFCPLKSSETKSMSWGCESNVITIKGEVTKPTELYVWIKQLDGLEWHQHTEVVNLSKDDRKHLYIFQLVVEVDNV